MKTLMVALLAFFALTLVAAAAPSRDCLSQAQAAKVYPGKYLKYREIGTVRCWFAGRTPDKSEFMIARGGAEPRATRATPSGAQRVQAAPMERRRVDVEALGQYVPAGAACTRCVPDGVARIARGSALARAILNSDLSGVRPANQQRAVPISRYLRYLPGYTLAA